MSVTLPVDGQLNWGDELNAAILQVETEAVAAQTALNNHVANSPPDPHGDRAYALSLIGPFGSGVNQPNGFVKLNGAGFVPSNLINGGLFTNVYDVVSTYGAINGGSSDTSTQLQNALNDAANAGGGRVWIPDGVYSIANPLLIGNNTWLDLSPGATIRRIAGAQTPLWMLTNFANNNSSLITPNSGPFYVTGGTWDSIGTGLTGSCTPLMFIQSNKTVIKDITVNNVANNPAIEINGCTNTFIDSVIMTGATTASPSVPAIRLNTTGSGITPAGMPSGVYSNAPTTNVHITGSQVPGVGTGPWTYGSFAGTDLTTSGQTVTFINISRCRAPNMNLAPVVPLNWSQSNSYDNKFEGFTSNNLSAESGRNFIIASTSSVGAPAATKLGIFGSVLYASGGTIDGEPVLETWHNMPNPSAAGWSIGGHATYRLTALGDLQVAFKDILAGSDTDGTTIWAAGSLPTPYRPTNAHRVACYTDQLRAGAGSEAACLEFESDGSIQCFGIAGAATRVDLYATIPITDPP